MGVTPPPDFSADPYLAAQRAEFAERGFLVASADAVIIATRWPEYASVKHLDRIGLTVVDPRRLLTRHDFQHARYLTIGST